MNDPLISDRANFSLYDREFKLQTINKKMKKMKKDTQGEIFQRVTFSDVAVQER
jgi:hypothetical protein